MSNYDNLSQEEKEKKIKLKLIELKTIYQELPVTKKKERSDIKRKMIFLIQILEQKEKKKAIDYEYNDLAGNLKKSEKQKEGSFAKGSLKKKKKYTVYKGIIFILILIIPLIIEGFLQILIYSQLNYYKNKYPGHSNNLIDYYFFNKLYITLVFTYFTIYTINNKEIKYYSKIIIYGTLGFFLTFISYLNINTEVQFIYFITKGSGFGIIGSLFLILSAYYLFNSRKKIKIKKKKKRIKITDSKKIKKINKNKEKNEKN